MAAAGGMGDGKDNLLAVVSYIVNELLMTGTSWIPGADPGFSERGVRKFKERDLECSPQKL